MVGLFFPHSFTHFLEQIHFAEKEHRFASLMVVFVVGPAVSTVVLVSLCHCSAKTCRRSQPHQIVLASEVQLSSISPSPSMFNPVPAAVYPTLALRMINDVQMLIHADSWISGSPRDTSDLDDTHPSSLVATTAVSVT